MNGHKNSSAPEEVIASPTDETTPALPQVIVDPTKDLWQNITLNTRDNQLTQTEVNLLVVGTSGGGKTSVLHRIVSAVSTSGTNSSKHINNINNNNINKIKPTTALDYSFARRNDRHISQVAHFWELAQGMELSQLCEVVITPENLHTVMFTIVVDCSAPHTMWETVAYWLKRIDRRVMEITQKMKAKGSTTPDKMLARAQRNIGIGHPDMNRMRISGIPTIIICNKLDAFPGDMTQLKIIVRCLRYISHLYGASLTFTSESDATKLRSLMSHVLFLTTFDARQIELDPERGTVLILPDSDTFADIGDPMISDMNNNNNNNNRGFQPTGDAELDRWKAPFDNLFPPKKSEGGLNNSSNNNSDSFVRKLYEISDGGFGEPAIDAVRKQKDEELEQYRKGAFKKEKSSKEERSKGKDKKERD